MLKSVRLKNVKLFREANIPLERLTVFVGPNGSGKTTVLETIYRMSQIGRRPVLKLYTGRFAPSQLIRRGPAESAEFGCEVVKGDRSLSLSLAFVEPNKPDNAKYWYFTVEKDNQEIYRTIVKEESQKIHTDDPSTVITATKDVETREDAAWETPEDFQPIEPGLLLRLDPAQVSEPSETGNSQIMENGLGVASALQEMALSEPDQFQRFQADVRAVIPSLNRVRMAKVPLLHTENQVILRGEETTTRPVTRRSEGYSLVLDMTNASDLPSESASEGTLLVIGILASLMGPNQPRLLLLDDIDRGLHPKATGDLIRIIRTLLENDPELQIIATSHSPYLLDHLKYEEVRITTLNSDGTAKVGVLSDHPDFDRWKDVMSPGEFWSTVGEKWLADKQEKPSHA
jgi:predicted ATPase